MKIICPTLKVCDYSIDDIFEKELCFLIPFHLFVYEKNFAEYNEVAETLADNFSNVQEGVRGPMFGNILEDEYYNGLVAAQKEERIKAIGIMKDLGISYDVVKSKLFETYGLSEAETEEYLKEY